MSNLPTINSKTPISFSSEMENDEIDLFELLAALFENKWLILFATLFALTAGVIKILLDTPVYKADALLQVEEHSQSLGALESVAGLLESKAPVMAEIEIVKSRMVLGEAVKNLNLEIIAKPRYFPVIGQAIARYFQQRNAGKVASPLFGQAQYAWGGEAIQVDTLTVPPDWLGKELTLLAGAQGHYKLMFEQTLVLEGEVGQLATRKFEDTQDSATLFVSRLKARPNTQFVMMRQSMSDAIDQLLKNLNVTEKGKNTGILAFALESSDPHWAVQTLNEIANIYVRFNVEQKSKEAQKTLEFLNKQLPLIKDQLETATVALNDYRTSKGSIDLSIETQSILNGVVEKRTQTTLLQQKRDELRQKFTESHPSIVAIDKQIARLQSQINAYNKKIEALPETQQVILRLSRDVQVNTGLYTTLLNNAQTLRVAKAGTVGDVRIIDAAVLPGLPIKPKKALIVALAGVLGLFTGIVLAFIRKAFHHGIKDPDLIEKHLNIPVYATIPHSPYQEKVNVRLKKNQNRDIGHPFILAFENKEDLALESLRSLRTSLHFAFLEAQNNIIMITGPSPGVGKTFVSTNLAFVLADAGKKILLIDGDLRNGLINKSLGMERENGLSELITESITPEQAIRKIPDTGIEFIPTGSLPPNPSELLMHERFGRLLETLSKDYDHVIIDSPPVLAVTDAGILGRMASATLMVVRAGTHPMRELEQSVKRLAQAGVQMKGIVFNDLPVNASRYGYGQYVYQYSYQKVS
ncbi:MAG: polysaccharide biosynthesis tyrosine autokinase [Gammaproteobacteria bacterium]